MNNEIVNENPNFTVWLIDIGKAQEEICKSELGDLVKFRVNKDNRLEVYNLKNKYLGIVAKKDTDSFSLIYQNPSFFQGEIIAISASSKSSYKVKVNIKVKSDASFRLFKEDATVLNKLVSLKSMFKKEEIIICNYGKVKIIDIYKDYLLVDVPHLGERKIYDLEEIERYHK